MNKFLGKLISFAFICSMIVGQAALADVNKPTLKDAFGDNVKTTAESSGYDTAAVTLESRIGNYIQIGLSLLGIIFLILMLYAGYEWMISQGDSSKVATAKNTMTTAIIGLVIILGAYAITFFVISRLTDGALSTN